MPGLPVLNPYYMSGSGIRAYLTLSHLDFKTTTRVDECHENHWKKKEFQQLNFPYWDKRKPTSAAW